MSTPRIQNAIQMRYRHDDVCDIFKGIHTDLTAAKTSLDTLKTLTDELRTDHGTAITHSTELDADDDTICNYLDYVREGSYVTGGTFTLAAGAAVTITGAGLIEYIIDGVPYYCDLDTTITLTDSGDVTQNKYGAWRILIDASGTVTTQDTGALMAWDSAQIALASLGAVAQTASTACLGYMTVIKTDGAFNIGTTNLNAANTTSTLYTVRGDQRKISGLNAALGASLTADAGAVTWSSGTINANRLGTKLAQIAAIVNQAMTNADLISTTKYGGWLFCVNLAGTGIIDICAPGTPAAAVTMTYASSAACVTALNNLADRLPGIFVPIGYIIVSNQTVGNFTTKTTLWDAATITTTETDCTCGTWDRTSNTGCNSHQINPPAVPASVTAPLVASITAVASTSMATLETEVA